MTKLSYQQIEKDLLSALSDRTQEVLKRRFALHQEERETLESIGEDFGVTRERIRQIEKAGLDQIREEKESYLGDCLLDFYSYFNNKGGIKREDKSLEELGGPQYKAHVFFLLRLDPQFYYGGPTEKVYAFWSFGQDRRSIVEQIVDSLEKKLKQINSPVERNEILGFDIADNPDFLLSCLEIAHRIESNPHGLYGLADWPQIKPRGLKDKSFLALKQSQRPLHFREITRLINSSFRDWGVSQTRKALTQTVHNELIRDSRFVLVGRGLYALKEWGYEPGTVADVIERILKNSDRPLTRGEIVDKVLEQRMVQENTIILNLSREDQFIRDEEGDYQLKNKD